ncbi:MAG: response regulator, partial [Armatimonadota bacterium]|nr:response regulator [Armatimonadota bacterium]
MNRKTNILVVAKDAAILDMVGNSLSADYTVLNSSDGPSALDVLKQRRVDAMVADMNLPEMPGVLVTQIAKRMFPDICTVLITSSESPDQARKALGSGASDYISKPLDPDLIRMVVQRCLERRLMETRQLSEERSSVLFSA